MTLFIGGLSKLRRKLQHDVRDKSTQQLEKLNAQGQTVCWVPEDYKGKGVEPRKKAINCKEEGKLFPADLSSKT